MTIIAHLQFGDNVTGIYNKEYLVLRYHTRIARSHNSYHPDSLPRCDSVEVTVIAPGKEDLDLHEWYFSNEYRSGRIVFELMELNTSGDNLSEHVITFDDAQCFGIEENYNISVDSLRTLTLKIGMANFSVNDTEFGNRFNK